MIKLHCIGDKIIILLFIDDDNNNNNVPAKVIQITLQKQQRLPRHATSSK